MKGGELGFGRVVTPLPNPKLVWGPSLPWPGSDSFVFVIFFFFFFLPFFVFFWVRRGYPPPPPPPTQTHWRHPRCVCVIGLLPPLKGHVPLDQLVRWQGIARPATLRGWERARGSVVVMVEAVVVDWYGGRIEFIGSELRIGWYGKSLTFS